MPHPRRESRPAPALTSTLTASLAAAALPAGPACVDVAGAPGYPAAANRYNQVTFAPVSTTRPRVLPHSGTAPVGLLEIKAFG